MCYSNSAWYIAFPILLDLTDCYIPQDLLALGHKVYVIADGVSSCNKQETPIALARLCAAGATVTSSESWLYEVMGDAKIEE